jgi:hypothetical protein
MHPIFALSDPERLCAIRNDLTLSLCLHEAGHAWVARALGAPFTMLHLPDLSGPARTYKPVLVGDAVLPAVLVNAEGLGRRDRISILLGGYAGELCLYERSYLVEGGELFTRIAHSADDAAGIARLLGLPEPADDAAVEGLLVAALKAADYWPYALLTRDLGGFRRWVSRLHAAWAAESFRRLGLLHDLLPPAA